ncbi:MAG: pantoate--beta-alanine ligase [Myxococcales bacterium]|nr:pantoate--beta-alanine ligase [Myxococcales bacterium]
MTSSTRQVSTPAQSVDVVRSPAELSRRTDEARRAGQRVAFVPTMGALHEGHLDLVRAAERRGNLVVVSIFVNPTQFGPHEDFERYPRDLEADVARVADVGAGIVFAPDAAAIYPDGEQTRVRVGALASHLCGAHRPGHFEGVATVVTKLWSIVGPCVAVFGRKDYQQLAVLRRVARDLFIPVEVVGHPIVRETDGLAMSSRNAYLSAEERDRARSLSRALFDASRAFDAGERRVAPLLERARETVGAAATSIDYVTLADPESLEPLGVDDVVGERALLAVAARVGATRLIDNFVLGEDARP